jgi:16S rRNA (cytidine1402-2'-O)-methyltransferase
VVSVLIDPNERQQRSDGGTLYIVATPIGNLADCSPRAVDTLSKVDLIAAEDTRHSAGLLTHFGLKKKQISLHAHNEAAQTQHLLAKLKDGYSIALVSDAGTPLLCDPGFPLVVAAGNADIRVVPIPGPSAVVTALSAAGLPCERFIFEGFLPARSGPRLKFLKGLADEPRTLVFYESPHRIEASLQAIGSVFGLDRRATIARELSKTFEQFYRGSLEEIQAWLAADANHRKGEFVLVVAGNQALPQQEYSERQLLEVLLDYLSVKQASQAAARITGKPKKELYKQAVALKEALGKAL